MTKGEARACHWMKIFSLPALDWHAIHAGCHNHFLLFSIQSACFHSYSLLQITWDSFGLIISSIFRNFTSIIHHFLPTDIYGPTFQLMLSSFAQELPLVITNVINCNRSWATSETMFRQALSIFVKITKRLNWVCRRKSQAISNTLYFSRSFSIVSLVCSYYSSER